MLKAVFDTNISIDYLNAMPAAAQELKRYSLPAISIITWIEVLVGAADPVKAATADCLATFHILGLDTDPAEHAVRSRRLHRIKLPDALIWASARVSGLVLITRNIRDFPAGEAGIHVAFKVESPSV